MSSSIELVLLHIINEKPTHAYEINKEIQLKKMRDWIKIGIASVYQVLDRLEKKGLVLCERERVGKMPERKKYEITEQGRVVLRNGIKELIETQENYYINLNVGLECSDILHKNELVESLENRLAKIKLWLDQNQKSTSHKESAGSREKLIMENLINFHQAEKSFLEKCLQELGRETNYKMASNP